MLRKFRVLSVTARILMNFSPRSTFGDTMPQELARELDLERIHFVGMIDYSEYLKLLQVSAAHVYLTHPFVVSWSFIEALACGCVVLGSATPPVLEVLRDGENGWAVDFFSPGALANRIEAVLEEPARMQKTRDAARPRSNALNSSEFNYRNGLRYSSFELWVSRGFSCREQAPRSAPDRWCIARRPQVLINQRCGRRPSTRALHMVSQDASRAWFQEFFLQQQGRISTI
jgi:hypothetical protein